MRHDKVLHLTAKIDKMPTLPTIVNRVLEVTADPDSSAEDLLGVIESDQSITTKMLKMANSAFYSRAREVATLKHALMTIGFDETRNLVLSIAVFNNYMNLKKVKGFDAHGFWRHTFLTGLAAKLLAQLLQLPTGELFVAGLIHDIGKLALIVAEPEVYTQIIAASSNSGLEHLNIEKQHLGLDHGEVGYRLLKKWMLPENLVAAVGFHHLPGEARSPAIYPLVVHLSDCLAHSTALNGHDLAQQLAWFNNCLSEDTTRLAQEYGIDLSTDKIACLLNQLNTLVEKQAAVFEMLFS